MLLVSGGGSAPMEVDALYGKGGKQKGHGKNGKDKGHGKEKGMGKEKGVKGFS